MCCSIVLSSASFLNSKRRFCFSSFCSSSCRAGSGILGLTLRNSCRFDPPTGKGRACKGQAANCPSRAGTNQELLDLAEESRRFRLRVLGRQSFEFAQQFALSPAEFLRRLDQDLNVHIAGLFGAQHRHALALKAEARPDWVPSGTFTRVWLPSMVGTSISPPNAARTMEIGTRQCRSAPSRWKNGCAPIARKM